MAKIAKKHQFSVYGVVYPWIVFVICGLACIWLIGTATNLPPAHSSLAKCSITMHLPETQPVDPEIQELVARQAKAWEAADSNKLIADFADNCLFVVPGSKFNSKQEIKEAADSYFGHFTDIQVTIKRIIWKGSEGAIEWAWSEKDRETGKESQAEDAIIFEVEGSQIKYWREYIDKKSNEG